MHRKEKISFIVCSLGWDSFQIQRKNTGNVNIVGWTNLYPTLLKISILCVAERRITILKKKQLFLVGNNLLRSTQSCEYGHLLENKIRFVFPESLYSLLLQSQSWQRSGRSSRSRLTCVISLLAGPSHSPWCSDSLRSGQETNFLALY